MSDPVNRRQFFCMVTAVALAPRLEPAHAPENLSLQQIAAEYRAGEVTVWEGWVLSWSEARLQTFQPGSRHA